MATTQKTVRCRFAPSPTGYLHVGGARTALYNYLYARKMGGEFVLRVEDTDEARSTFESLKMQVGDLQWLKLDWVEGPIADTLLKSDNYDEIGQVGPYRQSKRKSIYKQHADSLLQSGAAYYCFCTDEELEQKKQKALSQGLPPHYDGKCRGIALNEALIRKSAGESAAVRFKVPPKDYIFKDHIRGEVQFPKGMVGDFIILRSDGMPVYNFCCTVDDALMNISHVLRAEEHLSNTVRQLMLYEAFGYAPPEFGHLSIILGADRQKLSKRHGATSCHEYQQKGFLPEAIINFLALLGWSSPDGKEILSLDEMIHNFSLDRLHSASAVFDETKLKWMNAQYLRALDSETLRLRLSDYVQSLESLEVLPLDQKEKVLNILKQKEFAHSVLETFKSSMETFLDALPLLRLLDDSCFNVANESNEALGWETTSKVLKAWQSELQNQTKESFSQDEFLSLQSNVQKASGTKGKQLFMPLRVAVIGQPHGTELKLLVPLLKRSSLLARVNKVLGE